MQKFIRMATPFLVMSLMTGCAKPNVGSGFSLQEAGKQGYGLLVGTISSDDPGTNFSADTDFDFVPINSVSHDGGHITINSSCDLNTPGMSDFPDVCGHLFAVKLPASDYVISRFDMKPATETYIPQEWAPIKFTISAGKATYIGAIHMHLKTGGSILGKMADGGWPTISDRRERDMPLLLQRYPQMTQQDVQFQVLQFPLQGVLCRLVTAGYSTYTDCGQ